MNCARHGLAAGPDGRCVMCRREEGAKTRAVVRWQDRRVRRIARVVLAVAAGIAVFALLLATCDIQPTANPSRPASSAK